MKKLLLIGLLVISGSLTAAEKAKPKKQRPCSKETQCRKGWTCDTKKKVCVIKPSLKNSKTLKRNNPADVKKSELESKKESKRN